MYIIEKHALTAFHLPKYIIKKYVLMPFHLPNMSLKNMSLCHSVSQESNLMSLCMALRNTSFCHSVFKIWHWEIRSFVILSIEDQGPSTLFSLLSQALHQVHRSSTHSYMQHVSGASYPLAASHEPDQGTH